MMMLIKQKGNRYYRYCWAQMRSFPIKKSEALELIKSGEAELVEAFITDPTPHPVKKEEKNEKEATEDEQTSKVINLKSIREAKNEKESFEKAKDHFTKNILPNLNSSDMKKLIKLSSKKDGEGFQEEMMRIVLRMSIEEGISHINQIK